MMIDRQFLDVDFQKYPNFVFGDLGCPLFAHCGPVYEDSVPVIPENEWRRHIDAIDAAGGGADLLVTRIYDQKQEGSCVANATSQSHEITQAKQYGKENVVHLSAISLYKRIGRSPNSGAMVSDGLDEGKTRGILPLDNDENRTKFGSAVMPNTGWSNRFPDNWEATAKKFRFDETYAVKSVGGIITALLRQEPVVVGRAGHSICYTRAMYDNGSLVVKYANSWGAWGDSGFGYDSMRMIQSSASWAFCVRSVIVN